VRIEIFSRGIGNDRYSNLGKLLLLLQFLPAVDVEAGVTPGKDPLRPMPAEKPPADEKRQDLAGEDLRQPRVVDPRELMEDARLIRSSLGGQTMPMGMEIEAVAEGLEDGDDPRLKIRPGRGPEVEQNRPNCAPAQVPQKPALELEEHAEHLRDRVDDLAVRNIQEEPFPHPFAPLFDPLGVAGRAEAPGPAGEHNQPFLPATRAADPGEAAAGVAAIKIPLDHFLNDRPEKTVLE
jgi:hypothetical protein